MYKRGDVVKLIEVEGWMSDLTLNAYYEVVEVETDWIGVTDDVNDLNHIPPRFLSHTADKAHMFSLCEDKKFSINMNIRKVGDDDPFLHFDHLSMTKQQMIDTINQMWGSV